MLKLTLVAILALSVSAKPGKNPGSLIVGGEAAIRGEFPYMVDVRRPSHYCGASVINANWILTAAHCSQGAPSQYSVVAGDHNLGQNEGSEQTRGVAEIINHPLYNPSTFANDISMWHLAEPLNLSNWVQPIRYAHFNYDPYPGDATAAGWGALTEGGSSPQILNKVEVPLVSNDDCNSAYNPQYRIDETMICAGKAGFDSCQGDSGGPMVTRGERPEDDIHIGVVSWGIGCARPGYPGVYSRTSHNEEFIRNCTLGIKPPCMKFECKDKRGCIDFDQVCDGRRDCADGSDEHDGCPPCSGFKCDDGDCIPGHWECDGYHDCSDKSDEHELCICDDDEHKCPDGRCIPERWLCDGDNDCGDNSDEQNCTATEILTPLHGNPFEKIALKWAKQERQFRIKHLELVPLPKAMF